MASYADDHATYAEEQQKRRVNESQSTSRLDRSDPLLASFFTSDRLDDPPSTMFTNLAQVLQNYDPESNPVLVGMIDQLLSEASSHEGSSGVSQEFLDTLDRIPKGSLTLEDSCAICATPYLDDKYPLVVQLKCRHSFDMECITPWLKLHTTCPMCRAEVQKARRIEVPEDSEEEYDDTYG